MRDDKIPQQNMELLALTSQPPVYNSFHLIAKCTSKKHFLILPKHVGAEVQFPIEQVIFDGPANMYPERETYLNLAPAR